MVYTHGHHPSVLESHKSRTIANSAAYADPYFLPGARVLDIGSGPGTITAEIAQRIAPGELIAVEINAAAAQLTEDELRRQKVGNAQVVLGDVHHLDFRDAAFDVVHAHQMLQHVQDPVAALREMGRVCLYQEAARANGGQPDAGRYLKQWATEAGFTAVEATASTWEYAPTESRQWWGGMWSAQILHSDLTRQLLTENRATEEELEEISAAWKTWAADPQAWFLLQHNEVLIHGT